MADHAVVAAVVGEPERWLAWWPELRCEVYRDRGLKGRQWRVTGALLGTAEMWLEPVRDGVVLHWFLRAEPAGPLSPRRLARERHRWIARWTRDVASLKDELERGRVVGEPRLTAPSRTAQG